MDSAPKMRIRFFLDFGDSNNLKREIEGLCDAHLMEIYGKDKEIYITNDEDYTHAIILNTYMPKLKDDIPKENVVGLAYEPIYFLGLNVDFVEYAKKNIGKYFIGDKKDLPLPFIEDYSYMTYYTPLKYIPCKDKFMSIMVSNKEFAPGHKYRHQLVEEILKTDLPIDVYGRGCYKYGDRNDSRIKGNFEYTEIYENYKFHICIENFVTNAYVSEKVINPLLCSTVPVYLGCINIEKKFPGDVICLSGDLSKDMQLLFDIFNCEDKYLKPIDVEKIKESVSLLKNIHTIFS